LYSSLNVVMVIHHTGFQVLAALKMVNVMLMSGYSSSSATNMMHKTPDTKD